MAAGSGQILHPVPLTGRSLRPPADTGGVADDELGTRNAQALNARWIRLCQGDFIG